MFPLNPDQSWVIFGGTKGSSSAEGSEFYMIDPMQSTMVPSCLGCRLGIFSTLLNRNYDMAQYGSPQKPSRISCDGIKVFSVTCAY